MQPPKFKKESSPHNLLNKSFCSGIKQIEIILVIRSDRK